MNRETLLELVGELASLYPTVTASKQPVAFAELDALSIRFDPRGKFNWLQILREAQRQGGTRLVQKLLQEALEQKPTSQVLNSALALEWAGDLIERTLESEEIAWQQTLDRVLEKPNFQTWNPDLDPPSALLQAKYRVVPFSFRQAEMADLKAWCEQETMGGVRLYTGQGGLGKTRLLLEFCLKQAGEGWRTGFLQSEKVKDLLAGRWDVLLHHNQPLLLVLDYAESRANELKPLLQELYQAVRGKSLGHKVRVVLLARAKCAIGQSQRGMVGPVGNRHTRSW